MSNKTLIALFVSIAALVGCDDEEETTTTAEEAVSEAMPAVAEPAPVEAPEVAPAVGERIEATIEANFPTELAVVLTAPNGEDTAELGLVKITTLEGMSVEETSQPNEAGTFTISGVPGEVAAYSHNPAGDSGEDCPTLETIKGSLANAEIDEEHQLASEWEGEGPAYGDEMDFLLFHSGEQAGFFVRKRFDHGDDYTDICFASGTPQAPAANMTMDEAKTLAGAFLTAREEL